MSAEPVPGLDTRTRAAAPAQVYRVRFLPTSSPGAFKRGLLELLRDSPDLSHPARAVLVVLAMYSDQDGRAWPRTGTIARLSGYSCTAVRTALRELEAHGMVTPEGVAP